jgi:DNA-binding MarR family transcriptional regulator
VRDGGTGHQQDQPDCGQGDQHGTMLRTAGRISPIAARTSSEPMAFTAMRLLPALDAQLRRDYSINHFEYQVLAALSEAPERTLRMSDLAVLSEGSLSRLSQVVARLEEKNWVRRTPDPTYGRYTLAILTDDGWDKVAAAPGHVNEVRRLVIDPLTYTQLNQLTNIGQRIVRAIDPADRCLTDRSSQLLNERR